MCTLSSDQANETRIASVNALFDYLAKKHGYAPSAPVDVEKIAGWLGIEIDEFVDKREPVAVAKISLTATGPKVWINPLKNAYAPHRRFTLAHEIGHFCLHLSTSRKTFIDTKASMSRSASFWDLVESEANNFAAELLMPAQLIISEGNEIISRHERANGTTGMPTATFITLLARRLNTSMKATEHRLRRLEIVKQ